VAALRGVRIVLQEMRTRSGQMASNERRRKSGKSRSSGMSPAKADFYGTLKGWFRKQDLEGVIMEVRAQLLGDQENVKKKI